MSRTAGSTVLHFEPVLHTIVFLKNISADMLLVFPHCTDGSFDQCPKLRHIVLVVLLVTAKLYDTGNYEEINSGFSAYLSVLLATGESRYVEGNWRRFKNKIAELDVHVTFVNSRPTSSSR